MVTVVASAARNSNPTTKDVFERSPVMKLFARIFALSLVVTGAIASTHIANASQPTIGAKVSALPVPMCPPDDPNACGMGSGGH
jgi:hypothetical protein